MKKELIKLLLEEENWFIKDDEVYLDICELSGDCKYRGISLSNYILNNYNEEDKESKCYKIYEVVKGFEKCKWSLEEELLIRLLLEGCIIDEVF